MSPAGFRAPQLGLPFLPAPSAPVPCPRWVRERLDALRAEAAARLAEKRRMGLL